MTEAYEYDVAISFAGAQREYARAIADCLKSQGRTVFFDEYEQAKLWGADLNERLTDVYVNKARYCLMLVSQEYAEKVWTSVERKSALTRAIKQKHEYILPLRFDDTEIPGLLPSVAHIDAKKTPAEICSLVLAKLENEANPVERETRRPQTRFTLRPVVSALAVFALLMTAAAAYRLRQPQWKALPAFAESVMALEEHQGALYAGTHRGGVYRYDSARASWDHIGDSPEDRVHLSLRSNGNSLFSGSDSYGRDQSGLAVLYQGKWLGIPELNGWRVTSLSNRGSELIVGTYGSYFSGINPETSHSLRANDYGLAGARLINAVEGVEHGVFAGLGNSATTQEYTLFFLAEDAREWTPIFSAKRQDILCLASNEEFLFVGSASGFGRVPLDKLEFSQPTHDLPRNKAVQSLVTSGSTVIAGLQGGGVWQSTNNGETWTDISGEKLRKEFVFALQLGGDRILHVGTKAGHVYERAL